MGLKSTLLYPFAKVISNQIRSWSSRAVDCQQHIFQTLLTKGKKTKFGKDHGFEDIRDYNSFKSQVPIRDYEGLKSYVEAIKDGGKDILWPGKPAYFAKTSGTTSGVKYIPLTKDSIPNHFGTARNALFNYYALSGNGKFLDGKMIFLSGSPELEHVSGIPTGRLSGIVNHHVPKWLRSNQLPSYETNCIEEWETKLERIVEETIDQDMRLISGIPPWVQMYYEKLLERSSARNISSLFENFSVFVYGGVNFEPYRDSLEHLIGGRIPSIETYPASEGFIAFQDTPDHDGLLLNVNSGIFFEFVPADQIFDPNPSRYSLSEISTGINYALIISNYAGLWSYNIGDTVEFISINPPRIKVTGRIKHFISAFGEHVIGKEVEEAMLVVARSNHMAITEFTVAPQVNPSEGGLPYHEWFIEFESLPNNLVEIANKLNQEMVNQNIYYEDLINGGVLQALKITPLKKGAFREFMKSQGKLGGQNKVPRLSNDRSIANMLMSFAVQQN